MPRVVGVDIPNNKRLEIAFTYIFGVGRNTALKVCSELNLDPGMKSRDLTDEQITTLATHLHKTNARTRKGPKKTVAGKKSVKGMK